MTGSEKFLQVVRDFKMLTPEAMSVLERDMEQYDAPYYDELAEPAVADISDYGFNHLRRASSYAVDPWEAKRYHLQKSPGTLFVMFGVDGGFDRCTGEEASAYLYMHAKGLPTPEVPSWNPRITGVLVNFEELLGSVPEYMREVLEKKVWDETLGYYTRPGVVKLREWYDREVLTILSFLRCTEKYVPLKNEAGEAKRECAPVTAIKVHFGRFDAREEGSRQTTAFFSVSDASPAGTFTPSYNWFLQDTSRWLYAGCIALDFYQNDGEEAKVTISSHH